MASLQDDKGGAISSPTLGSQSSTDSTDRTISPGSKGKFERFEHKGQLEAVIRDPKLFKRLMKQECWSKQSGFKITSIENLLMRIHFTRDGGSGESQFMISDALFDAKFAGTIADV